MANQNQPGEFDAVLGGQAPPPVAGVILGGLEGVKSRLLSSVVEVQVAALSDTLYYRDAGLDLVIEALPDISGEVLSYAARLLREQGGLKGKQALLEHNPWLFFTTLKDWQAEIFHPQIGIKNSSGIAYIVSFSQLQLLLQDPQVANVEALICHLYDYNYDYTVSEEFYNFVEILFESRKRLTGLKALFLGERITHNYRKSHLGLGDISLVLEGYPQLEVLHIRGCCNDLECSKIQHNNLKTLIIETANISDLAIYQICSLHLPALEYFELWMGRSGEHQSHETIDSLKPILFGESFPNLSYLGLRSSEYANEIADAIAQSSFMADSPIIDNLVVLDLSMGNLTDDGLEALLECAEINNLHTLNISNNCISEDFLEQIEQFSPLNCSLIADFQEKIVYTYGASRYYALHE